ncbi:hypothetical protein [Comamonas thiooxydans]|uniref:hypothetical protein n=1 Tax=Comamonas thiooxydans TaxID=363952 RepID=UPI000AD10727|nr:hypothetical protein [Comamonas thiooxydans]
MINWADMPQNIDRFENLLSDPDVALQALKGFHSYLRNRLQNHELESTRAAILDGDAIASMSEIHGRIYKDDIEPLSSKPGTGIKAPEIKEVQTFASTLQAIFDSATKQALHGTSTADLPKFGRQLKISATDDSQVVILPPSYSQIKLLELACLAFTGLAFADSGANLAVLKSVEKPNDLDEQLTQPDRISLALKAVKFRAGGKLVEIHLSATTMTRINTYLLIRQSLVDYFGKDIAPMFIQCSYQESKVDPTQIIPLKSTFIQALRRRLSVVGVNLGKLTLRELRAFKQQELVTRTPLPVAAKLMGHTAVKAYCKANDGRRRSEISSFFDSLEEKVLKTSQEALRGASLKVIPIGSCVEHGKPSRSKVSTIVEPNCDKVEGCFFCDNYRVHADELDLRKLMSCRRVLQQIVPLNSDSLLAYRVYTAICDRIDALLGELKRRNPAAHETVRIDVEENGALTNYWARKLQQLHLLGMLPAA